MTEHKASKKAIPNLNARTLRPDGSLFIPEDLLTELTDGVESPFNFLARHKKANNSASHGGASSFKWQSTLCSKLPARPGFEIASCFWEDKKPEQEVLDVAYRQNRMATTEALRQLHALNIQAPIFGLVWSEGTVRAHVDWWEEKESGFVSAWMALSVLQYLDSYLDRLLCRPRTPAPRARQDGGNSSMTGIFRDREISSRCICSSGTWIGGPLRGSRGGLSKGSRISSNRFPGTIARCFNGDDAAASEARPAERRRLPRTPSRNLSRVR